MDSPSEDDDSSDDLTDANIRMRIGQMRLTKDEMIAEGVYSREPPYDPTEDDLQGGQFIMDKSYRKILELGVSALSIIMLCTASVDHSFTDDIAHRIEPYDMLIGITVQHINITGSTLKEIRVKDVRIYLTYFGFAYFFVNIGRLILQYKVYGQEDDYYFKKRDSFPITLQYFISHITFALSLIILYRVSRTLNSASKYSGQILKEKMSFYATGAYPDLKRAIDRFQINYECCGSESVASWYDVDLYQLEANYTRLDPKMQTYLHTKYICHYNISRGSAINIQKMNTFIDAHKGNKADKSLNDGLHFSRINGSHHPTIYKIKSLPFSCCNMRSGKPCPFFNHANLDNYWKGRHLESLKTEAIYSRTCDDVVREKLVLLGTSVEIFYIIRIAFETFLIIAIGLIRNSFQSEYEHNFVPSVTSVSVVRVLIFIVISVVFYFWGIHFWRDAELARKYFGQ